MDLTLSHYRITLLGSFMNIRDTGVCVRLSDTVGNAPCLVSDLISAALLTASGALLLSPPTSQTPFSVAGAFLPSKC